MDHPVFVVRNGAETIAYLKGDKGFGDREKFPFPAIIFLDLKMPIVGGFEVLEWIRSQPELKKFLIVVLSHCESMKDMDRAYSLGANSFLTKPMKEADIMNLSRHFSAHW